MEPLLKPLCDPKFRELIEKLLEAKKKCDEEPNSANAKETLLAMFELEGEICNLERRYNEAVMLIANCFDAYSLFPCKQCDNDDDFMHCYCRCRPEIVKKHISEKIGLKD